MHPGPAGARLAPRVAVGVMLAAYLGMAAYCVLYGRLNNDEGWYLYAARLVYHGRWLYRDFAFFQAPLLPYLYGLPQRLCGPSLLVGRFTSLALSLVTVALGARLAREAAGCLGALLFLGATTLTPAVVWSFSTTRTEPLSAALLMTTAFLLLRRPPRTAAMAGAVVTAVLLAATRVSSLVVLAVVVAWVLSVQRPAWRRLPALLLPATVTAALIAIPLLRDPAASWFDVVTAQAERHNQLAPAVAWSLHDYAWMKAMNLLALRDFYGFVPVLAVIAVAALAVLLIAAHRRGGTPAIAADGACLALLGTAYYLPNLAPRAVFPEYFAPVFPLFLVLGCALVGAAREFILSEHVLRDACPEPRRRAAQKHGRLLSTNGSPSLFPKRIPFGLRRPHLSSGRLEGRLGVPAQLAGRAALVGAVRDRAAAAARPLVSLAVILLLLVQARVFIAQIGAYTDRSAPALRALDEAAAYVRSAVPAGRSLLTMDTYLAVAADRSVPAGWEMSLFSYFPRRTAAEGARFHIITPDRLAASFDDASVGAVALTDMDLGILVTHRYGTGYRPAAALSEAELRRLLPGLRRYRLARVFDRFGQFADRLYVWLPAAAPPPAG